MRRTTFLLDEHLLPAGPLPALNSLFTGYRMRLVSAACVFFFKHSPVWAAPIVTAEIINLIVGSGFDAMDRILGWSLLLFLLIVQNVPTHMLYVRLLNGSIRAVESRTRMALIRRLQRLPFSFHDEARSGELQTKVLRDVENIGIMVTQMINIVMATTITILIALIYTLIQKPAIALFFLITIPLAVALVRIFGRRIHENTQRYRKDLEGMSVRVTEALSMLPITRAHATENFELARITTTMNRVADSGRNLDIWNGIFGASSWVMFQLFSLLSLLVSGFLALRGEIPIGDVVLYQGFFSSIVGGVNMLLNALPEMAKGVNAIRSIGEVLSVQSSEDDGHRKPTGSVRGAFEFRNVCFTYPSSPKEVITDLSLSIPAGSTTAFVGESGSGKSTLMNLVIGFYRPVSGEILLDGRNLAELNMSEYRSRLSVVSQNIILFSGSIRDNICYGLSEVSEARIREAIEAANAATFIDGLPNGLDTQLGEHGSRLSGGQRQRIAIARAIIRNPSVIILDEATSALDLESERLVQEALSRLIRDRTTFIVAHRLSTIRTADRIVVLRHGRIVETGTHQELLAAGGVYAGMHALNARADREPGPYGCGVGA